ncbi:diaminopropionate ammonia-lyase [Octadecabacter temperatus]|uniref:Diaminopropionate ammonia-lyase n=1 Tax=Octadecabacter temperatus TaxID=1458307 RepID=A0A0K0Y600_9RHOB|nr:diaminopropionate ammonia-lyase [Octadecabacter temperatus]AKS46418.1 Diaminopropionate ammonia-lyase [Octadecabacter temperatus]SIO13633.1 diaminopropionate ammonia-lyase [Octadecabacter temperatus]
MFTPFKTATLNHHASTPLFDGSVTQTLNRADFDNAEKEISNWDGYAETPLLDLPGLAGRLDIGDLRYKHEGPRFGLGSFKALGGAYAVLRTVQRELSKSIGKQADPADIRHGLYAEQTKAITVISATDGNHGRSVAWGAAQFHTHCRIYIHAEVSEHRADAMRKLGAEVISVDGDYDATVAQTRADAEKHGWLIVSDTSWPGYTQPPLDVMSGYGVMAREIVQSYATPPTHVFLQGGVGGLAAAVTAVFHQKWGLDAPRVVIVEPELAPCLFASAKANKATNVEISKETIMAGLSCGEPSELAWSVLTDAAHDFVTIPDSIVGPMVRLLANGVGGDASVEAGESGVAGLSAVVAAANQLTLRRNLHLDANSRIVVIGSEGITDPSIYAQIIAGEI